jgi:predicted Zn finger-like uncharacterized protein
MSLATRCTSCGTAFRVVQDQLKVSEGWVRCGRCNAVFSALEGLFDLGRDAPPGWEEPVQASEPRGAGPDAAQVASSAAAAVKRATRPPADEIDEDLGIARPVEDNDNDNNNDGDSTADLGELLADPIDAHLFGPRKRTESAPKPAGQLGRRDRVEFSDARFDSDLDPENTSVPDTELATLAIENDTRMLEGTDRPEFIRHADRRARWQSTSMRVVLGLACAVATLALVAQAANHYRDSVAAQWPALRPALASWCRVAQCRIEAPRRLEDIILESSGLTQAAARDSYVLSLTLKSRSPLTLALPSIDLTLTDANGRLVARRALAPRDLGAADVIAPHAETALQVLLSAGTPSVVGYNVEIFYP